MREHIEIADSIPRQGKRSSEIIAKSGTLIAHNGSTAILAPYDECVLVMPSLHLHPGQTAVRLGRFTDVA